MTLDLDRLLALAKAATPGPWVADMSNQVLADMGGIPPHICDTGFTEGDLTTEQAHNATYIAAMSPDVCVQLVEELKRLRVSYRQSWSDVEDD